MKPRAGTATAAEQSTARDALAAQGVVGRADLLLALASALHQGNTRARAIAGALGYVQSDAINRRQKKPNTLRNTDDSRFLPEAPADIPTQDHRMALFGAAWLPGDKPPPQPELSNATTRPSVGPPLTAADWMPAANSPPPAMLPPIVARQRLLPALQRLTSQTCTGALDVHRLAQHLATRQLPAQLPRRAQTRPARQLSLVLDTAGELSLYRPDMHQLARWLDRHPDLRPLRICVLADPQQPMAGWLDWRQANAPDEAPAHPQSRSSSTTRPWWAPQADERLLLVSDLGLAERSRPHTPGALSSAWCRWLKHMRQAGAQLLVLSPVPLQLQKPPPAARAVNVVHWSAAAPLRAKHLTQGTAHHTPQRQALAYGLLARLACAPWVDLALLRQLRRTLPAADDAGLEHLAWQSAGLTSGVYARRLQPHAQRLHRSAFQQLPVAQQWQALQLANDHYQRFSPPLAHMHALAWASRASAEALAAAAPALQQAQAFVQRLATHATQPQGVPAHEVSLCLSGWLQAADDAERRHHQLLFAALWLAWQRLHPGQPPLPMPAGVAHHWLAPAATQAPVNRWLVFDAQCQQVLLSTQAPQPGQGLLLAQPMQPRSLDVGPLGGHQQRPLPLPARALQMLGQPQAGLLLRSPEGHVQVGPVQRPRGVLSWWQGPQGMHLRGAPLGALFLQAGPAQVQLQPAAGAGPQLVVVVPSQSGQHPGVAFGIDAEFGLWLDWTVGSATQRFRWIAPGEFWMGSPDQEPGRDDDEGPRHRVHISQGFWVADTPCTQAFWHAVTGQNPSHFKGDGALPVETVSWEDLEKALHQFNKHLPAGVNAALPSEAQWEYAARAGTETAFNLGHTLHGDQANLGHQTCAVKQYRPNPWGLYDCHGQVLEWCADGMRNYGDSLRDDSALRDPLGPAGPGGLRAVRGGAWGSTARRARSACRGASPPGSRDHCLGFRLVLCLPLRSTSPDQNTGPEGRRPRDGAQPGGTPGAAG